MESVPRPPGVRSHLHKRRVLGWKKVLVEDSRSSFGGSLKLGVVLW